VLLVALAGSTAEARNYPKGWTWKQEKEKHYANGSDRPIWMPKIWFAIASCEQPYGKGAQWDAYSAGYEGAFGFAHSSWDAFKLPGYPDSANLASTWQQYQVALAIYRRYGFSGWGCYTGGGYKYHM
jgi:hypothetical protein